MPARETPRDGDGRALVGMREGVPGEALFSRELRIGDGVEVARHRFASVEVEVAPLAGHLVTLHLNAPTPMAQRWDGRVEEWVERPGDVAIVPVGRPFAQAFGAVSDNVNVLLADGLVRRVAAEAAGADPARVEIADVFNARDPQMERIMRAFLAELEADALGGALYADALATQLAVHLLRQYSSLGRAAAARAARAPGRLPDAALQRVADYIEDNLTADLSLAELAGVAGYSPYHFARLFRQSTGRPPHQYVIKRRVERAAALLSSTALSVEAVAHAVGFPHRNALARHMKRLTGHTPAARR